MKAEYYIKRPGTGGRASFSLIKRVVENGKRRECVFAHERVDTLNRQWKSGVLDLTSANMEMKRFCDELNAEERKRVQGAWVASSDNMKLFTEYWAAVYERKKVRKEPARNRLLQALDTIGIHSLLEAAATLQTVVDRQCAGHPRRQRKVASSLNQMRKWFGITKENIHLARKTPHQFKYLTEDEFLKVRAHMVEFKGMSAETFQALTTTLFATGARVGEAYALSTAHIRANKFVNIDGQMLRSGIMDLTKTGKSRRTLLLPIGADAIHQWVLATDRGASRTGLSKMMKAACKRAFPKRPDKWITIHDLRHSFAVHCLTVGGLSIDTIAKLLGNSPAVCNEYYLNFIPEDDVLQAAYDRLSPTLPKSQSKRR